MTVALRLLDGRTFRSLRRHRNYRLFFSGQVVSVSGTWMQNIGLAWLVIQLSHHSPWPSARWRSAGSSRSRSSGSSQESSPTGSTTAGS